MTTNTRGGWEDDVFLSFREAQEVGYSNVESFIHYFVDYWDKPKELQKKIDDIGVNFVTISNGAPLEMRFDDPTNRGAQWSEYSAGIIEREKCCKPLIRIKLSRRPTLAERARKRCSTRLCAEGRAIGSIIRFQRPRESAYENGRPRWPPVS